MSILLSPLFNTNASLFFLFPCAPHHPQANHSATTANAIYGNTGRGIGNTNYGMILGSFQHSQMWWRVLDSDAGNWNWRVRMVRSLREELGKSVVGSVAL